MESMTLRDAIREMVRYVQGQPKCNPRLPWCPRCEAYESDWDSQPAFRNGLMNLSVQLLGFASHSLQAHEIPEDVVTAAAIIDAEDPVSRRWRSATRAVWATR